MKILVVLISALTFSASAFAGLAVGVTASYQQDTWDSTSTVWREVEPSSASNRLGVLLWIPLLPTLSIRTGYLLENQKITSKPFTGSDLETKVGNSVIPANLQFELPFTGLYAFGGLLFVTNQTIDPGTTKFESDQRINLGAGYEFFSLPLMGFAAEIEYQKGSKNLSSTAGFDLKLASALALNLVFKLGF